MDAKEDASVEDIEEYNFVVNQTFRTEEEFYQFYNNYAKGKGFGVRKDSVRRRPGTDEVIWRRYLCSSEGFRSDEYFERIDRKRQPRKLTRCGCPARLDIQLSEKGGIWYVKDFVDGHDHPLLDPQHVFVLWSHRGLNDAQKAEAIQLSLGGLHPCQIMEVLEKSHGGPGETGFILQDLYNFFAREKKENVRGCDVEYVLNFMDAMKEEDPEFYFKYSTHAEGRLQNIFWSDSQSQLDYGAFGDVVVFDSTYRVNRYNLPFVSFVGLDHHRKTVLFGCGILSDETVLSYVWLLEAFLEAMRQWHPRKKKSSDLEFICGRKTTLNI